MIRPFVSFCLGFYKSRTQLQLEIVYLRKQLEMLSKDSPEPREVQAHGEIENVAVANGLHHYYFRIAAQETLQGQLQGGLTTLSSFQPIHYEVLSCTLD